MTVPEGTDLILFVAGRGPNSVTALGNLRRWCRELGLEDGSVEIVDVVTTPARALEQGVLLTPQLVIRTASGVQRFVGTLHDGDAAGALRASLGAGP